MAITVTRLAEGLWRWTAPHPEWNGDPDWGPVVGSVYSETPEAIVLIDPLVPADPDDAARFWRALDRDARRLDLPVAVLLTCRWHARSTADVRGRYGARVWAPADGGHGLGDLVTDVVADAARPFAGVTALVTGSPAPNEECIYVLEDRAAVVVGDILLGSGAGLRLAPPSWYANSDEERDWYRSRVRPSLERVLEYAPRLLLPAHGDPITTDAAEAFAAALRPS
jgi:glyoxylase-like metal-dependent hydrolase (beta-lactamase superfamily II)